MKVDRSLLFGVLAVQRGYIDATALALAIAACAEQHNGGVGDALTAQGYLSGDQRRELDRLLDEHIQQNGGDYQATLEALRRADGSAEHGAEPGVTPAGPARRAPPAARDSDAADQPQDPLFENTVDSVRVSDRPPTSAAKEAEAQHFDTIDIVHPVDERDGTTPMDTLGYEPEQRSRYTLTRVEGEGGLGQVWLAIDSSLNRQIALKNIRPDKDASPEARRRLVREAQITGQLEHPNIIPIYELERADESGKPYYTMRLLKGSELSDKIGAYHERRKAGQADPMDLRELLNAFVDICNAMAYAGARGVVHRDLKPQNVMIGEFGEVLVVDWGLAKAVGSPDDDAEVESVTVPEESASKTVMGAIMGSPAYMAPEQAAGRLDLIDPRTDVYGLGAILFTILVGESPHRGQQTGDTAKDTRDLIKRVSAGQTRRPRDVDSSLPRALDAICSHAMEKERSHRYQTAADLARDVERWLADEPVSVYQAPWRERLGRWLRRHRAWAQSIAAAMLLVTGVATVAAFVVEGARQREVDAHAATDQALKREQEALGKVREAKDQATRHFQQARHAVDESFIGVSGELTNYPGTQALRTRLLEKAAQDYERFAAESSSDPQLRLEFARGLIMLGDVRRLLNAFAESEQAYKRAISVFEEFLKENEGDRQARLELAKCHTQLGLLYTAVGPTSDDGGNSSYDKAEKAYGTALQHVRRLRTEDSKDHDVQRLSARVQANRGVVLYRMSRADESIEALNAALDGFQSLAEETDRPQDHEQLAQTRISLAALFIEADRAREAEQALQQAITAYEQLVRDYPEQPSYLLGLADARTTLGNALYALGRTSHRLPIYESVIADYTALINTRPDVPLYRDRLGTAEITLAQALYSLGRNEEAKQHAEQGLGLALDHVNKYPELVEYHVKEVYALATLGQVLRDLREFTLAETAFNRGIEKGAALVERFPQDAAYRRLLAQSKNNLGVVHLLTGDHDLARRSFMEARDDFEAVLKQSANDVFARDGLAWSLNYLGDSLRRLGRPDEAKTFYRMALEQRQSLGGSPQRRYQQAWFLLHCEDAEFHDPDEALIVAQQLSRADSTNASYLTLVAAAYYRQGKWGECLAKLDEAETVRLRGKDAIDFWRSMALHQSEQEATGAWQRGVERMEQFAPGDFKLINLRREAAQVLGIEDRAQPPTADPAEGRE